jgi:hypothetical protein
MSVFSEAFENISPIDVLAQTPKVIIDNTRELALNKIQGSASLEEMIYFTILFGRRKASFSRVLVENLDLFEHKVARGTHDYSLLFGTEDNIQSLLSSIENKRELCSSIIGPLFKQRYLVVSLQTRYNEERKRLEEFNITMFLDAISFTGSDLGERFSVGLGRKTPFSEAFFYGLGYQEGNKNILQGHELTIPATYF